MKRVDALGLTGVAMLLGGATTFLSNDSFLPLWITWIVGPLFWYLGFAVMLVWGYQHFFGPAASQETEPQITIRFVRQQPQAANVGRGPMGVIHEIPSMGVFIL